MAKVERAAEEQRNRENGTPGDVDFQRMIRNYRERDAPAEQVHTTSEDMKICICVRKRPISSKEIKRKDYDSVTCLNPLVVVHDCKMKVDGISKYLDNTPFEFDHTFHEDNSTDDIYLCSVQPLVDFVVHGGRATVFAYGQTGSGKTYTMQGVQKYVAEDLYALLEATETPIQVNDMSAWSLITGNNECLMSLLCRLLFHTLRFTEVGVKTCSTIVSA